MDEKTEELSILRSEIMGDLAEIQLLIQKIEEEEDSIANCQLLASIAYRIVDDAIKRNERIGIIFKI